MALAITDQEKLALFIEGLDFGVGALGREYLTKDDALALVNAINSGDEFDEYKALEHELLNGLAYAPNLEIAIAHIKILCDYLHSKILNKYLVQSNSASIIDKWNIHIDSLSNVNENHLIQQQAILYNYEMLFQLQEGNYRLAGFNLGQFMRFVVASEVIETESAWFP